MSLSGLVLLSKSIRIEAKHKEIKIYLVEQEVDRLAVLDRLFLGLLTKS